MMTSNVTNTSAKARNVSIQGRLSTFRGGYRCDRVGRLLFNVWPGSQCRDLITETAHDGLAAARGGGGGGV